MRRLPQLTQHGRAAKDQLIPKEELAGLLGDLNAALHIGLDGGDAGDALLALVHVALVGLVIGGAELVDAQNQLSGGKEHGGTVHVLHRHAGLVGDLGEGAEAGELLASPGKGDAKHGQAADDALATTGERGDYALLGGVDLLRDKKQ